MAGIGFELKKLFSKRGFFSDFKAFLYAALVTVGPQILCMTTILVLHILLSYMDVSYMEKELFLASVCYAFIFSQILTSGFSMVITRYIADKLYTKENNKILSALYGIITICLVIGSIVAILFLYNSPINFFVKLVTYILFMELIIMWLESVFLSAIKDYRKIVICYFLGTFTSLVLGFILIKVSIFTPALSLLIALSFGIFIIISLLMFYIKSFFKVSDKCYFMFLSYFDKYSSLFFISFFYTVSLYMHNFIIWLSDLDYVTNVQNTYLYAPIYDVPTFFAFLTILPASVIFVVSVETSFYDKYKEYYSLITNGGNLRNIKRKKNEMKTTLSEEIFHIMEVQLFISLIFIAIGNYVFPFINLSAISIDIFNIITLGAYCTICLLIVVLIQLYFDNRKGALISTCVFFITSSIFTYLSIEYIPQFIGIGFFAAALISLIVSLIILSSFLKELEYITFCSQPIVPKEDKGFFSWITNKLYN